MTFTTTAPDDDARRERARQHFAWQDQVAERSDLSPVVRLCAWALARRRNVLSGHCSLSYAGLAKRMGGLSERSAIRAIRTLERAGLIVVDRRVGRGHTNLFTFVMSERVTQPCQGFAAEKGDKPGAKRPPDRTRKGDIPGTEKVTELCHPNMKGGSNEPPQHAGERARAREAPDISSRRCRGAEMKAEGKPAKARPGGKIDSGARAPRPEAIDGEIIEPIAAGFEDLLAVYARPWGEDQALASRRYDAARREVGHAAIMKGARRWAEVYAGHNGGLQFMKPLDHWLAQRLWQAEPPRWKAPSAAAAGKARKPRQAAYDPVAGAKRAAAKILAERAAWDASGGWAGVASRL
jgi:hypothetical protein